MFKESFKQLLHTLFAGSGLLLPLFVVNAQVVTTPPPEPVQSVDQLFGVLVAVFNILFWALIILAVIFVVIAAFRYLTASGDPEKIKKANHTLIYVGVAIIVAIVARGAPNIICSLISGCSSVGSIPVPGI